MRMTGAKCNLSALYQRVDRFCKRKSEEELAEAASYEIKRGRVEGFAPLMAAIHRERGENSPGIGDFFEVDALPAEQSFVSDVSASAASSSSALASASLSASASSREQRIEFGLANFPSWMKPEVARHSMKMRHRKSLPQAHLSRLVKKMDKSYQGSNTTC